MPPSLSASTGAKASPAASSSSLLDLWRRRELVVQLTLRNVKSFYRGSVLGFGWTLVHPLITLAVYVFVFTRIFEPRWTTSGARTTDWAFAMFCGLIVFHLASHVLTAAPGLVANHRNFAVKMVFPLEVLPLGVLGAQLLHSLVGVGVLLAVEGATYGSLPWTIVLLPLGYVPLAALTLGLAWLFSGLGVYGRDFAYFVQFGLQTAFFLTPIVYPIDAVPPTWRFWLQVNPLTTIVDFFQRCLLWGTAPDWTALAWVTLFSAIVMCLGYVAFMKLRVGFADVL